MTSLVDEVRDIYITSRKQEDIFWNIYVARPLAAILVYALKRTPITPNQVSFLGVGVFFFAAAFLALWPTPIGLFTAAIFLQLSYLFDCADGQLARLKGMTSDVGAYLDFFMDEIKALLLVAAATCRMWITYGDEYWLLLGIFGVMLVAVGTALTGFIRRPEYAGHTIKPGESAKKKPMPQSMIGRTIWFLERVASWIVHYPSWFLYIALIGFIPGVDGTLIFLVMYLGIYIAYVGRTTLSMVLRLASPSFYKK